MIVLKVSGTNPPVPSPFISLESSKAHNAEPQACMGLASYFYFSPAFLRIYKLIHSTSEEEANLVLAQNKVTQDTHSPFSGLFKYPYVLLSRVLDSWAIYAIASQFCRSL